VEGLLSVMYACEDRKALMLMAAPMKRWRRGLEAGSRTSV